MLRTLCINLFPSTSSTTKFLSSQVQNFSAQTRTQFNRFTRSGNTRRPVAKPQSKDHVAGDGKPDSVPVRPISDLWKALGFTAAVGLGSYTVAALFEYRKNKLLQENPKRFFELFDIPGRKAMPPDLASEFNFDPEKITLSPGQKIVASIIAANVLVTVLWRMPSLRKTMYRYFTNSFASKSLCSPMVLSVFSHSSLIHLGLNMYVLLTFAGASSDMFMGPATFAAFYCTAGAVSSFTSVMHKAIIKSPIRALGASGAICGILAYTCMKIPNARLKIIFFPFFDFSAQHAVYGLIAFDLLGLIFRFKMFDHAAHLGGTLFGILYALYIESLVKNHFRDGIFRLCNKATGVESVEERMKRIVRERK